MEYKLDDDYKGLSLRFSDAEFKKFSEDANSAAVPLPEIIEDLMMWHLRHALEVMVQSGTQHNIPKVTVTRVKD